jgi:hypothetical protein
MDMRGEVMGGTWEYGHGDLKIDTPILTQYNKRSNGIFGVRNLNLMHESGLLGSCY